MRSKESEHLSLNTCLVASLPRVIPNSQGLDLFNEYEVDFGNQVHPMVVRSILGTQEDLYEVTIQEKGFHVLAVKEDDCAPIHRK